MATKPTTTQIYELAEKRTADLGYPKEPTGVAALGDRELYRQRREELYENQLRNAESELTRRYERDRDRETARETALKTQADEREDDLRRRFDTRFPGGSDADYQALRPALLAELSAESAAVERDALATARRRISI